MAVTRYEPWSLLQRFQEDVNRALGEAGYGPVEGDSSRVVTSHWSPAVDIKEEKDRYLILADLPGVDAKDIEVTMEGGVLTIRGERGWENDEDADAYKRVERARGTFYRRFSLPDLADPGSIKATSRNGVLEIAIAKQAKAQPRRIQVGS